MRHKDRWVQKRRGNRLKKDVWHGRKESTVRVAYYRAWLRGERGKDNSSENEVWQDPN